MRSLDEWLDYQNRTHSTAIDLGLARVREVLRRLGWRGPRVPVITVAGTNGKGSVSAYCSAMLAASGRRVGTFTSPHLRDYRERLRVHDALVSAAALIEAFERIERARGEVSLTFFEYNALAAFLVFDAAALDAWVLEIGMGGRLDAVNVIDPDVAVVVSIGLDHQEFLGDSLEAIAREKAGIFRASRPAVLGSRDMPGVLMEIAQAVGATPLRLGVEYEATLAGHGAEGLGTDGYGARDGGARGRGGAPIDAQESGGTAAQAAPLARPRWSYRGPRWRLEDLPPPALLGATQYDNAATAIAALEALGARLPVDRAAVAAGLERTRLMARFQVIRGAAADGHPGTTWILDVAHNPAAARVLAANLRASRPPSGHTLAVCGILADKDAEGIAAELADCVDAWWCAGTEGERGRGGKALAERVVKRVEAEVHAVADIESACAAVAARATAEDRIVVFGSFHTVGPALTWLERRGLATREAFPDYTAAPDTRTD